MRSQSHVVSNSGKRIIHQLTSEQLSFVEFLNVLDAQINILNKLKPEFSFSVSNAKNRKYFSKFSRILNDNKIYIFNALYAQVDILPGTITAAEEINSRLQGYVFFSPELFTNLLNILTEDIYPEYNTIRQTLLNTLTHVAARCPSIFWKERLDSLSQDLKTQSFAKNAIQIRNTIVATLNLDQVNKEFELIKNKVKAKIELFTKYLQNVEINPASENLKKQIEKEIQTSGGFYLTTRHEIITDLPFNLRNKINKLKSLSEELANIELSQYWGSLSTIVNGSFFQNIQFEKCKVIPEIREHFGNLKKLASEIAIVPMPQSVPRSTCNELKEDTADNQMQKSVNLIEEFEFLESIGETQNTTKSGNSQSQSEFFSRKQLVSMALTGELNSIKKLADVYQQEKEYGRAMLLSALVIPYEQSEIEKSRYKDYLTNVNIKKFGRSDDVRELKELQSFLRICTDSSSFSQSDLFNLQELHKKTSDPIVLILLSLERAVGSPYYSPTIYNRIRKSLYSLLENDMKLSSIEAKRWIDEKLSEAQKIQEQFNNKKQDETSEVKLSTSRMTLISTFASDPNLEVNNPKKEVKHPKKQLAS